MRVAKAGRSGFQGSVIGGRVDGVVSMKLEYVVLGRSSDWMYFIVHIERSACCAAASRKGICVVKTTHKFFRGILAGVCSIGLNSFL